MTQLDKHDLNWVLRVLPKELKDLMEQAGDRIVLGGGFIRSSVSGERPNDIDLFCKTPEDARHFAYLLAGDKDVLETPNAYSIRKVGGFFVQFIHRWTFNSPREVLESFDFTIACSAVWWGQPYGRDAELASHTWASLVDDNFYSDLAGRRLIYRSPMRNEDAGGSLLRVLKFYQKGFRIPLDSLGGVLARLVWTSNTCDMSCASEEDWATRLTAQLFVVDPQADPAHEAHLPSLKEVA